MPRLPMALFVDPQDVILRMQLDKDLTGIEEVIVSGIQSAQLHVERIIDGRLARRSQHCMFHIDAESFSGIAPGGAYRLEIPSGLVRKDVPQVVTASSGTAEGPFTDYGDVEADLMRFDYARGYLYMDTSYGNYHVQVKCDTGYEDGTRPVPIEGLATWVETTQYTVGDVVEFQGTAYECYQTPPLGNPPADVQYWKPAFVPQEPLPDAIYEAIMALVPMVFNSQQTTNRSKEAKEQYQTLTDHANLLLQPWVRTKGFTFRPVFGNTA